MATEIDLRDLAARAEEVGALVKAGEEVVLMDGADPRARLVPIPPRRTTPRIPGLNPGSSIMAPDFDDELPDSFWLGEEDEA